MSQTKPSQFVDYPDILKKISPWTKFRAVVEDVYDGDTLKVIISIGFDVYIYKSIRLKDVYAPELGTPLGPDARNHLPTLCPIGSPIILDTDNLSQTFTRYIGTIHTISGVNVNSSMNEWIRTFGGPAGAGTWW